MKHMGGGEILSPVFPDIPNRPWRDDEEENEDHEKIYRQPVEKCPLQVT
jgi:hypothetical protein